MTYNYKSEVTQMLKSLRMSRKLKIKSGWSRDIGAGFIAQDISTMQLLDKTQKVIAMQASQPPSHQIKFTFGWGTQTIAISDLNLRETEESIKWLELRQSEPDDKIFIQKLNADN